MRLQELLDELRARKAAEAKTADDDDRARWSGEGGSPVVVDAPATDAP